MPRIHNKTPDCLQNQDRRMLPCISCRKPWETTPNKRRCPPCQLKLSQTGFRNGNDPQRLPKTYRHHPNG